jgi:N-acetylmuramoyl-L-alanine amidase
LRTTDSETLAIDTSYVFPRQNWELKPGDIFKAAVKGTPGCTATFSIEGIAENLPMTELYPKKSYYWGEALFDQGFNYQMGEVRGIYYGVYDIQPWDWGKNRKIIFTLENAAGKIAKTTATGTLNINQSSIPQIAQLTEDVIKAHSNPSISSQIFLPKGAKVNVSAVCGDYARINVLENDEFWLKSKSLEILPRGSLLPDAIVSAICTSSNEQWCRVAIEMNQRLPFRIEQSAEPASFKLTFFGVSKNSNPIQLELSDSHFRDISWQQTNPNSCTIKIDLKQRRHWGFDPVYQNGKLFFNIKKQPKIAQWPHSPLRDLVICLDPGHTPETGSVGPSGLLEKDLNFAYCEQLQSALEKKGALVVFTHDKFDGMDVDDRPKMAVFLQADILLSLHFNALPDGVDPFKPRGIATYYSQPHSYRLAHLIQQNLLAKTTAKNFSCNYTPLVICRTPQMISVLIEPGFLTIPEEEMLITTDSYQKNVVEAIINAMEQFLIESR